MSERDVFLAFLGRLLFPTGKENGGLDTWRVIAYLLGPTGCGKTKVYELLNCLIGKENCQVFGSGKHGDKFTINSQITGKLLLCAQDMDGEAVTADQLQQMAGGEAVSTRDMQSVAQDAPYTPATLIISNNAPPWHDKNAALQNRIAIFH